MGSFEAFDAPADTSSEKAADDEEEAKRKKRKEYPTACSDEDNGDTKDDIGKREKSNLNSGFHNLVGLLQTISLLLNAGLMVYAHVGLSGVVYASRDPNIVSSTSTNKEINNITAITTPTPGEIFQAKEDLLSANDVTCTANDVSNWIARGGIAERKFDSNFCAKEYNGGCLMDVECVARCFQTEFNYTYDCGLCFAALNPCVFTTKCLLPCAADAISEKCTSCKKDTTCDAEFYICSGLPEEINPIVPVSNLSTNASNVSLDSVANVNVERVSSSELDPCKFQSLDDVSEWFVVYNLTFVGSVRDAWEADVQFLSILIVVFSGIWPYAKNVALLLIWYIPMTHKRRSSCLIWLSRLSKYTLVDVFAVIVVIVACQLDLNVGGLESITRCEPRFAIIAFLLATVWEFAQIEWMRMKHENFQRRESFHVKNSGGKNTEAAVSVLVENGDNNNRANGKGSHLSCDFRITLALLLLSVVLLVAGASLEILRIDLFYLGGTGGCFQSYRLAKIGGDLINDISFDGNIFQSQNWTLYIFYVLFVFILPISVHLLQTTFLNLTCCDINGSQSTFENIIGRTVGIMWGISSVEVFLIGAFAVEYKFPEFIKRIAGEDNAKFLDVESALGPGFYILIVYSIIASVLQFMVRILHVRRSEKL